MNIFKMKINKKIITKSLMGLGISAGFGAYLLPNTVFVEKYKNVTQLYKNMKPYKISTKVQTLFSEVLNDMEFSNEETEKINLYVSYGFDIFSAGILPLGTKCVIGLPKNFSASNVDEFSTNGVLLNGEEVDWLSEQGRALKQAFIFSDDAIKFAAAQKLILMNSYEKLIKSVYTGGILLTMSGLSYKWVNSLQRKKATGVHLSIYSVFAIFSYIFWAIGHDNITCRYETKSDEAVAKLGKNYIKGGYDFYDKTLQRNVALRRLMKEEGEALYTAYGNIQMSVRSKHVPLTQRRDYFKSKLDS